MSMMRYDPLDALTPLRESIARLFEEGLLGVSRFEPFGRVFPLDIRDTATEYVVEAAIPGVTREELQVTVAGNTLTIQATHKHEEPATPPAKAEQAEKEEKEEKAAEVYVRRERYIGEMRRVIELPAPIEATKVTASYEHGILTLHVPKATKVEPVTIPIQVKEPITVH